jgi:hypothetical protein
MFNPEASEVRGARAVGDWETRALERRCAHCRGESPGRVYSGQDYVRVLQGLRGDEALRLARLVGPFFWSDADMMHVRLCDDCRAALGIDKAGGPPSSSASVDCLAG